MTSIAPYELISLIKSDMRQAMKDGRRIELDELKSVLARISNAEAISPDDITTNNSGAAGSIAGAIQGVGSTEAQRRVLSTDDILAIVRDEHQEILETLAQVDSNTTYASEMRAKAAVVERYL